MTKPLSFTKRLYKNFIKLVSNSTLPYLIKITLIFFSELIYNSFNNRSNTPDLNHLDKERSIKNKTILITGGSGGIGTNLVKHLSKNNKLIILTRQDPNTNTLYLNDNIQYLQVDLEKIQKSSILEILKEIEIDSLICMAGVLDSTNLKRNFSINFTAHRFLATNLKINKILLVSSCVALTNYEYDLNESSRRYELFYGKSYATSKYFLFDLADELIKMGRNVQLVHPGVIDTSLFSNKFNLIEYVLKLFIKLFGISTIQGSWNVLNAFKELEFGDGNRDMVFWYMDLKLQMVRNNFRWIVA